MSAIEEVKERLALALEFAIKAQGLQIDENEPLNNVPIEIETQIEYALAVLDGAGQPE